MNEAELLQNYRHLTGMQILNLRALVITGRLAGTGRFVILPVDQDNEHGPAASFQKNPAAYDPLYYAQLAVDAGCNGFAAPLGAMELAYELLRKAEMPTVLKVNSSDMMMPKEDPFPAVTAWVDDAVRLNCEAVGFTIYPGSKYAREMYEQVRELVADARIAGKIVVVWAYPRGSGLPTLDPSCGLTKTDVESALDVVAYGVRVALQLGAHIVKCKPPNGNIVLSNSNFAYQNIPKKTLAERVAHIVKDVAFGGRRIVIFSGGPAKRTEDVLDEVKQIAQGGGHGSIIGRNSFQRPHDDGVELLHQIMNVYKEYSNI